MPDRAEMAKRAKAAAKRLQEAADNGTIEWFDLSIGVKDGRVNELWKKQADIRPIGFEVSDSKARTEAP